MIMPFEIDFEDVRIGFASAHFIVGHDKCGHLHGHNYFVRVNIKGTLNEEHMILDYGILKDALRKLVKPFDHHLLVPIKAQGLQLAEKEDALEIITCGKRYLIPKEDVFLLPLEATTAEELAKYFHQELKSLWPSFHFKVSVEETPGASATYYE